jgi:beta-ureidopropionase / N-carbamoyl-L-amino-acid hydrolase
MFTSTSVSAQADEVDVMAYPRWKAELIELGKLGRRNPVRTESFADLDLVNGLYRMEGTKESKQSKEYLISRMKNAGLQVRIDRVGNVFARKEGKKTTRGAVMSGSHLDSVLNGGMFDGPLGVISALEAVRILADQGFENERPIEVVAFMGEEGSAFRKVLLGSFVLIGKISTEEALTIKNDGGITLKDALDNLGLRGDFSPDLENVEYFIEIHVEQGPVLDKEKISIGIVENITGLTWVNATLTGQENHAGTTPMNARKDALVAAAEIVQFVNRRAKETVMALGGSTVATVGRMIVYPGAPNIVPGAVEMGIDIRDADLSVMLNLQKEIIAAIRDLKDRHGVESRIEIPFEHPPKPCSQEVIQAVAKAASSLRIPTKRMNSGAGHDAQNMAEKVKTAMLFVPSIGGISHSPLEWTNWEDIENGIKVLTETIKILSQE